MRTTLQRMGLVILMLFAPLMAANAQIKGKITDASARQFRVAIPDFTVTSPEAKVYADRIKSIIEDDLNSTGLFKLLDEQSFVETQLNISLKPRFGDWRLIQAENVMVGQLNLTSSGELEFSFRLWDTGTEQQRLFPDENGSLTRRGNQFSVSQDNLRRLAHVVADNIYTSLTGDIGYFDTRIVFIHEAGPKTKRIKRLAIMDQDGANSEFLTNEKHLVLTPRFSPTAQTITYMTYESNRPQVYLFDINTGRSESLGQFDGMTYAPRFSPDGQNVVFTQEINGNSELYILNLTRRETTRLTDHPAIDVSPSMSPDGKQIAFTSDRGGRQQIYIMNTDGSAFLCPTTNQVDTACRITGFTGGGYYSTPVWSPRGDYIAFTKQAGGQFYIGVIQPDGRGERLLTESYLVEAPAWSPNGRVIIFTREARVGDQPKLFTIDLTGRNLRAVKAPGSATDPAWSPPLR